MMHLILLLASAHAGELPMTRPMGWYRQSLSTATAPCPTGPTRGGRHRRPRPSHRADGMDAKTDLAIADAQVDLARAGVEQRGRIAAQHQPRGNHPRGTHGRDEPEPLLGHHARLWGGI